MLHIEECLEKFEKLRHRQAWWFSTTQWQVKQEIEDDTCESGTDSDTVNAEYDRVNSKHLLLICPDGDILKKRKQDCLLWKELLFTDPLWVEGQFFRLSILQMT